MGDADTNLDEKKLSGKIDDLYISEQKNGLRPLLVNGVKCVAKNDKNHLVENNHSEKSENAGNTNDDENNTKKVRSKKKKTKKQKKPDKVEETESPPNSQTISNDCTTTTTQREEIKPKIVINYKEYESELQMPDIMQLIQKDLSEPYSIYTYRYFIHNWPKLCFLAMHESKCVGAIVCKLDMHKMVRRGYIAMLAVDKDYRKLKIGTTLVQKAIEVKYINS